MTTWTHYDEAGDERLMDALLHGDASAEPPYTIKKLKAIRAEVEAEANDSILHGSAVEYGYGDGPHGCLADINAWIDLHRVEFWTAIACGVAFVLFAAYWSVK